MKNRAKCKKCNSIIESFHSTDYVDCKCGAISVCGGDAMLCAYRDINDFIRVDDQDNEVIVKEVNNYPEEQVAKPNKQELIKLLDDMVKNIENLPKAAMATNVNHYDLLSLLLLLSSLFKAEES